MTPYNIHFFFSKDSYTSAKCSADPAIGIQNHNKKKSTMQFYSYSIHLRSHGYRALFNQILANRYAKIETDRLMFIGTNRKE